jgi:hypothetical protein
MMDQTSSRELVVAPLLIDPKPGGLPTLAREFNQ